MKRTLKFSRCTVAVIAFAVTMFVFAAAPVFAQQKSLTVSGIPSSYNNRFAFITLSKGNATVVWASGTISRGSIKGDLLDWTTDAPWNGSGSHTAALIIYTNLQAAANKETPLWTGISLTAINITRQTTTVPFDSFISADDVSSSGGGGGSPEASAMNGVFSAGGSHGMFIKSNGTLWAWGNNNLGQLGDGTTTASNTPKQIGTSTNWKMVSAGGGDDGWKYNGHSVGIQKNGTLWAWGNNERGATGLGTTTGTTNTPTRVGTASDWAMVSAGGSHNLAIKTNGTLWAWGDGENGRLGNGQTGSNYMVSSPVQIGSDSDWMFVSAGGSHSMAIKKNGTLWAWGSNTSNALGDGTTTQRTAPVKIGTDTNWKFVSAGSYYTVAVKTNGTLWAWGSNSDGNLGDGTTTQRSVPTKIGSATNWICASAGGNMSAKFAMGLQGNGTSNTLWGWGGNLSGRTGQGTTSSGSTLTPTKVGTDSNWQFISSGSNFALAVRTDNALWGWGSGTNGRLGQGNSSDQGSPVSIVK